MTTAVLEQQPATLSGRTSSRMMLDHYSQTKCLLVSYDPGPMGFF